MLCPSAAALWQRRLELQAAAVQSWLVVAFRLGGNDDNKLLLSPLTPPSKLNVVDFMLLIPGFQIKILDTES